MKGRELFTEMSNIYNKHRETINHGFDSLDKNQLARACEVLADAIQNGKKILTCGNGASASIAQHWACDYFKGCSNGDINPQVFSISANIPLMTAISNDIGYDDVYAYQVDRMCKQGDVLITISSSGNSPNVVKAIMNAKHLGVTTIALTGFSGGNCRKIADIPLHIDIQEYEATEDVHQAIMHIIAKALREILL